MDFWRLDSRSGAFLLTSLPSEELHLAGFLLGVFFDPEDGANMFLSNISWFSAD
jgi:hypothetical protein